MPDSQQHFDAIVTPNERWQLFLLMYGKREDQTPNVVISTREEGKRFRRAAQALGMAPIREATDKSNRRIARETGGSLELISAAMLKRPGRRHTFTVDNAEYLLKLPMGKGGDNATWSVGLETIVGDFFDRMAAGAEGRPMAVDAAAEEYKDGDENWDPTEEELKASTPPVSSLPPGTPQAIVEAVQKEIAAEAAAKG